MEILLLVCLVFLIIIYIQVRKILITIRKNTNKD